MASEYVAPGVRTKLYSLLYKFNAEQTLRFGNFTRLWRETKFPLIFSDKDQLPEFTEEVLAIAKEFVVTKNHLHPMRVGGLYALYGLYMKQPIRPKIKIRITYKEWKHLQELMEHMKTGNHYDVVYIYAQLRKDNAFHYCATARKEEYAVIDGWEWDKEENVLLHPYSITIPWDDFIEKISICMQQYHADKCQLQGAFGNSPPECLNVFSRKSSESIINALDKAKKAFIGPEPASRSEPSGCEDDDPNDPTWMPRVSKDGKGKRSSREGARKQSMRGRPRIYSRKEKDDEFESSTLTDECREQDLKNVIAEFQDLMKSVLPSAAVDTNTVGNSNAPLCHTNSSEDLLPTSSQDYVLPSTSFIDRSNDVLILPLDPIMPDPVDVESRSNGFQDRQADWDKEIREMATMNPFVYPDANNGEEQRMSCLKGVNETGKQKKKVRFLLEDED